MQSALWGLALILLVVMSRFPLNLKVGDKVDSSARLHRAPNRSRRLARPLCLPQGRPSAPGPFHKAGKSMRATGRPNPGLSVQLGAISQGVALLFTRFSFPIRVCIPYALRINPQSLTRSRPTEISVPY